jgi:hypothetical protein
MAILDEREKKIRLRVAVMGGASELFVSALGLNQGEMHLGAFQGFATTIAFDTFPVNPWKDDGAQGKLLEQSVPQLDALVLTDALTEGTHYSSTAVERLERALGPRKAIPTAIFGGPALSMEWETLVGKAPACVVEPIADNARQVVKALAAVALRSLRRSEPPPPA